MNNDDYEFVEVFTSNNLGILAIAKSLLNSAGIEYKVKDEFIQSILGVGMQNGIFSKEDSGTKIFVKKNDEKTAKELLKDLIEQNHD